MIKSLLITSALSGPLLVGTVSQPAVAVEYEAEYLYNFINNYAKLKVQEGRMSSAEERVDEAVDAYRKDPSSANMKELTVALDKSTKEHNAYLTMLNSQTSKEDQNFQKVIAQDQKEFFEETAASEASVIPVPPPLPVPGKQRTPEELQQAIGDLAKESQGAADKAELTAEEKEFVAEEAKKPHVTDIRGDAEAFAEALKKRAKELTAVEKEVQASQGQDAVKDDPVAMKDSDDLASALKKAIFAKFALVKTLQDEEEFEEDLEDAWEDWEKEHPYVPALKK